MYLLSACDSLSDLHRSSVDDTGFASYAQYSPLANRLVVVSISSPAFLVSKNPDEFCYTEVHVGSLFE